MKLISKFCLITIFSTLCSFAYAHEDDGFAPESVDPQRDEILSSCLIHSARAAWGADARFHGSPAIFKYVPAETIKQYMSGKTPIPADAIYVAVELDMTQRKEYEVPAFFGWKQANSWVNEGKRPIERHVLISIFMDACKKAIAEKSN